MSEAAGSECWTFVVEAQDAADSVLRVLNPFLVAGAALNSVSMERTSRCQLIRVEALGLGRERAETLRLRLRALPAAIAVAMMWRAAQPVRQVA